MMKDLIEVPQDNDGSSSGAKRNQIVAATVGSLGGALLILTFLSFLMINARRRKLRRCIILQQERAVFNHSSGDDSLTCTRAVNLKELSFAMSWDLNDQLAAFFVNGHTHLMPKWTWILDNEGSKWVTGDDLSIDSRGMIDIGAFGEVHQV
jgi:hypothetical protein